MSDGEQRLQESVARYRDRFHAIVANVENAVRGKNDVVKLSLVCLLADGHLLIEDVPGVGKTTLARALAESIEGSLQRIQFTPDLLPTDVTGAQIFDREKNDFRFHAGPVFANVVVADEINRASPKTQSALLEVMEEHQVTVDGEPLKVPDPFIVIATQNPVELDGTYELPEAQLDRFLMQVTIGYPDVDAEIDIVDRRDKSWSRPELEPVIDTVTMRKMATVAEQVHIDPELKRYIVTLSTATRTHPDVRLGVSPRGSLAMAQASRALAASDGRTFVTPDDVRFLAPFIMNHRIILAPESELRGVKTSDVVDAVINSTTVPRHGT